MPCAQGRSLSEVIQMCSGDAGTPISMAAVRSDDGAKYQVNLVRAQVQQPPLQQIAEETCREFTLHIETYIRRHACACMYVCMYVCMCIYIYIHMYMCVCVYVCVCIYIYIMYIYIYIYYVNIH